MAVNGSTSVAVTAYDTLKFTWTQYGQSTVNNYTTINWSLQLVSGSAGKIISTAVKDWSVTINGTTSSGTNSVGIENNSTKTLASGQVTIPHNADGTKSFSYSFSQEFAITFAGASVGTIRGSGTGTLNTIPRATQPSLNVTSIDMGQTVTIYTPRASDAFTHDLAYSFAGGPFITIQSGVATYMYWMVPPGLADSIPNTTNGTVTIRCITKNGTAEVGTKTVLLTAKVPATVVPTISAVTVTEGNTGTITTIGSFVQTLSKVKATITAAGAYSSTIKSYTSTFEGKNYTGASFTSDTITGSGSITMRTTVTDSRGRTATKTSTISVLSYSPPKITTLQVARSTSAGVADPNGEYVWIRVAYAVTSLNSKNTASAKFEYKKSTATTWSSLYTRTDRSLDTTLKPTTTFSTNDQWDFQVTLTDAFTSASPTTYTAMLPSGAVILDIKADGKGIAFFKTSTKDGVDIAGEIPGSTISLTSGANLNTLTTPGFYAIPTTTVSGTILNKPYTDTATASIKVERTGDGMVRQILQKSTKDNGVIYERGYSSNSWGSWSIVYGGAGKLLWTGNYVLTAAQSLTFSEKISEQQHGVVLVFSRYASTGVQNYAYSCHFIPKMILTAVGTTSVNMNLIMGTAGFEYVAGKNFAISDTGITGNDTNSVTSTSSISGITYYNGSFALRYVIGV